MTQEEEIQGLREDLKVCLEQLGELWILRDELPDYATKKELATLTWRARWCLIFGVGAAALGVATALLAALG